MWWWWCLRWGNIPEKVLFLKSLLKPEGYYEVTFQVYEGFNEVPLVEQNLHFRIMCWTSIGNPLHIALKNIMNTLLNKSNKSVLSRAVCNSAFQFVTSKKVLWCKRVASRMWIRNMIQLAQLIPLVILFFG